MVYVLLWSFFFFNFTILYCFCHISTWIHHRNTCVPHPESSSVLSPPSPYHPSGSSQCTSPKHPALCIEPGLVPNLSSLNYECAPDSSIYDFFPPMVLTLKLVRSQVYFKAMALHSSTLAWKIPWTEEPGGAAVHGIAKSRTRLSDFTFAFHFHALEKEMATHSSVLAWRIPEMGEPGGLPSMGSHRVWHDWSNLAAATDLFLSNNYKIHELLATPSTTARRKLPATRGRKEARPSEKWDGEASSPRTLSLWFLMFPRAITFLCRIHHLCDISPFGQSYFEWGFCQLQLRYF